MIAGIIRWSARNTFLVLLATAFIAFAGVYAVRHTALDGSPISPTRKSSSTPNIPARRRR
jgi:Cu/Ag efflux pump CusA